MNIGRIALGCVTFGREIDEAASREIMDYALANGITLFDTAEAYGGSASETIIGRCLRDAGTRSSVIVQTKTLSHKPEDVARAIETSLNRLQVDCIDIYLLHKLKQETPLEETLGPIAEAVRKGRIARIGSSNCTAAELRDATDICRRHGFPKLEVQQPMYNLVAREIEAEFLPLCRAEGLTSIAFSPLGAGFLTGKYRSDVPKGTRFDVVPGHQNIYFKPRNFEIVERLAALSDRTRIPMVRLAMGFALENRDIAAVLVGARTTAHLDNALQALREPLAPALYEELDRMSR